jgi:hypothetical protein
MELQPFNCAAPGTQRFCWEMGDERQKVFFNAKLQRTPRKRHDFAIRAWACRLCGCFWKVACRCAVDERQEHRRDANATACCGTQQPQSKMQQPQREASAPLEESARNFSLFHPRISTSISGSFFFSQIRVILEIRDS